MHEQKEKFRNIFEKIENVGDGICEILDWLPEAAPVFPKSAQTIKRWFGEIVGYFEQGTTNSTVEGINNKLKLIKRAGYGFRNTDNFILRALLCWHFVY
jgi:transposase